MAAEGLRKTANDLIHIGSPLEFDDGQFIEQLERLMAAAYANDVEEMLPILGEMVTTYKPAKKVKMEPARVV